MSTSVEGDNLDGVAIIGMAGRFPRARNVDEFWRNLRDGVEAITFFSDDELAEAGISRSLLSRPDYVKALGVLEDAELFDNAFFGFQPKEAEIMNPQHRLFLECAWEALEDAAYQPETYDGLISAFGGASMNTYFFKMHTTREVIESGAGSQSVLGNERDYLTTRVSYKLNLRGPSLNVQTACSTSLVAVHLACQSLLNYQCDLALAGGVTVRVPQKIGYIYQEGGIDSPDGHCRAFDAQAKGTIGGSGLGIVVLKRLADALTDGDNIRAVIRGTAINNDGSLKVGYTAPSIEGQAAVIAMAQAVAGVEAESISYIEAHGTGTPLGDPIEIAALTQAFHATTSRKNFCAVGSVKTNIGHLDAAAGVAGLMKTVLALEQRQIPPSLHFREPNPQIDFANSPFYVNSTLTDWATGPTPRRAGVSSFGIGGTNAHAVVEEAPPVAAGPSLRPWQLLVLSARTPAALEVATSNMAAYLKLNPTVELADVAYTCHVGRTCFEHRRMLVCSDPADAVKKLDEANPRRVRTAVVQSKRARPIVFMFTGQGAQYVNMAAELYQVEETFRRQVDLCVELLKPHLGLDLREVIYPVVGSVAETGERLGQTVNTQPALFVIEYALAQLWMEWGIRPQAMIGHSVGEYVAACLAGVFSLEDALALVSARGQLMQKLPAGAMLGVMLAPAAIEPLLGPHLSLAAINGPTQCIVSGPRELVTHFEAQLTAGGAECSLLQTSHAFHSEMMEPILRPFAARVAKLKLAAPRLPYISNLTGNWITATEATDPTYWARHLRHTVQFAAGVGLLLQDPERIFLEVGPGRTLSALAKQQVERPGERPIISSLRHPREAHSDAAFILDSLGELWLNGVEINWPQFYAGEQRRRVSLPTYPFERRPFWYQSSKATAVQRPVGQSAPAPVSQNGELATTSTRGLRAETNVPVVDSKAGIITQQLQLMMKQLEVIRRNGTGKIPNPGANDNNHQP